MAIRCKNGAEHTHETVMESRQCWNSPPEVGNPFSAEHPWNASYYETPEHPGTESRGADRHEEQWDDTDKAREKKNQQHPIGSTDGPGPHGRADEEGLYQLDRDIFRLRRSKAGRLYAMRLSEDDEGKFFWEYWKGKVYEIKRKHRMSSEQATKFGLKEHRCVNCFRGLTRGESKRRGYGPKCAVNYGWPYDHDSKD